MNVSHLEVNFTRLLARCESMAAEKRFDDWRLEKYVLALDEMLAQLSNLPPPGSEAKVVRPPSDMLAAYRKKTDFLRNLSATEKLTKAGDKARASAQLLGGSQTGPARASASDQTPGKTSQLQMTAKARVDRDLRDELFANGEEKGGEEEEEKKKGTEKGNRDLDKRGMTSEDLDQVMQHHKNAQEKIAEEMLVMARHLKESTSAAGKVVRDDTQRIQASSKLADANLSKLQVQSKRLEAHVKKCCDWWVWISLLCVCATFIMMVLFMKLFKKSTL